MRELNECKAEVFRRSEKRMKERKRRRKHILLTCIPMVLCIMMLGVYVLPEKVRRQRKKYEYENLLIS